MGKTRKSTALEWLIFLGLTACAIAIAEAVGMEQRWKDAFVYTVVLFTALITTLRPWTRRKGFWRRLTLAFSGHLLAVLVVIQSLPPRRYGVPKLLLFPIGAVEGLLIAAIMINRSRDAEDSRVK